MSDKNPFMTTFVSTPPPAQWQYSSGTQCAGPISIMALRVCVRAEEEEEEVEGERANRGCYGRRNFEIPGLSPSINLWDTRRRRR